MKRQTYPNVSVSLYDGEFHLAYDCVGEGNCKFALCSFMPPSGEDECFFREYGSCRCSAAQHEALKATQTRIKTVLKAICEEEA